MKAKVEFRPERMNHEPWVVMQKTYRDWWFVLAWYRTKAEAVAHAAAVNAKAEAEGVEQ